MRQFAVDFSFFLLAQFLVPARQAVLDLPVGMIVLLEDHTEYVLFRELKGCFGARNSHTNDNYHVPRFWVGHILPLSLTPALTLRQRRGLAG